MHMYASKMIRYQWKDKCNRATEMRLWRRDVGIAQRAGDTKFSIYDREDDSLVEGVTQFQ